MVTTNQPAMVGATQPAILRKSAFFFQTSPHRAFSPPGKGRLQRPSKGSRQFAPEKFCFAPSRSMIQVEIGAFT
jgi:hypothetical protein